MLTARGWLWTISTAFSLLRCSHKPSEANMRKESLGWRWRDMIVGLAVKIGMFRGSEILNFILIGSLLYCACFIYASPIDLETCRARNKSIDHTKCHHGEWIYQVHKVHSKQTFNSIAKSYKTIQKNQIHYKCTAAWKLSQVPTTKA